MATNTALKVKKEVPEAAMKKPEASAARSSFKGNYELFGEYCAQTEKSDKNHCIFLLLEKKVKDPKDLKESMYFVGRRSTPDIGDPLDIGYKVSQQISQQHCGCGDKCGGGCPCKKSSWKCCEKCKCKCSKRLKLSAKDEFTMKILKAGGRVPYIFFFKNLTQLQAKYTKACLIAAIGLKNLTNKINEHIPQKLLKRCEEEGENLWKEVQGDYKEGSVQYWTPPSSSSDSDSESDTSEST